MRRYVLAIARAALLVTALFAAALLATPVPGQATEWRYVTEMLCQMPFPASMDSPYKCENPTVVYDLQFAINPVAQKVQMTILDNFHNPIIQNADLGRCSVVDAHNWSCDHSCCGFGVSDRYAMRAGRFVHCAFGPHQTQPALCYAGVTGWRRFMVRHRWLTPAQAQSYE
jgi:hypothetical protein